jgi:Tfp pilus assembly protein PilO
VDFEKVKEFLNRIPYIPILLVYLGIVGFQTYNYVEGTDSPIAAKETEIHKEEDKLRDLEKKVKDSKEFIKNLETKRQTLRSLTQQLNDTRTTLSEDIDIPAFIKMVVTEAKKVGLTVNSIQPTQEKAQELYVAQSFDMSYRGVFVQLIVFLERLASLQKIIRTDEIEIHPVSSPTQGRFAEIEGKLVLETYKYAGAKPEEANSDKSDAGAKKK